MNDEIRKYNGNHENHNAEFMACIKRLNEERQKKVEEENQTKNNK